MGLFNLFFKEKSKNEAKNRLKLVLTQDRAMISPSVLEDIKDDILEVLNKYVEIDQRALRIEIAKSDSDSRKVSLVANIPIKQPKIVTKKTSTRKSTKKN